VAVAVQKAIHLAEGKASRGQVEVHVDVPDRLPRIHGDEHQLTQLFTNLLINAYEAMGGQGRIAVSAEAVRLDNGADGRDAVKIEFADNGPGIPSEVAEKVFSPFFTTKAQGSGLGLSIVRKIVDAHDGRIDVESSAARGTTFTVYLPREEPRAAG
jgi:signal transduction histidine kinase